MSDPSFGLLLALRAPRSAGRRAMCRNPPPSTINPTPSALNPPASNLNHKFSTLRGRHALLEQGLCVAKRDSVQGEAGEEHQVRQPQGGAEEERGPQAASAPDARPFQAGLQVDALPSLAGEGLCGVRASLEGLMGRFARVIACASTGTVWNLADEDCRSSAGKRFESNPNGGDECLWRENLEGKVVNANMVLKNKLCLFS
jgi:hypothetical protein